MSDTNLFSYALIIHKHKPSYMAGMEATHKLDFTDTDTEEVYIKRGRH